MQLFKNNFILILTIGILLMACSGSTNKESTDETAEAVEVTPEYVGEEVSYTTDSTRMNGYLAYDKNAMGIMPGVIVVHEWWGHNDYTRKRADMLAELGYVALAIDMYGDGKQAAHPEDASKFSGQVMSNMSLAQERFEKALETLKKHPNVDQESIAAIGYCFGGSVVLTMANAGMDLDAVAAFHSGVQLPVMPNEKLKAKVLVCNGAADPFVSAESIAAFKAAMDSVEADYKFVNYEGAVHAFTSQDADSLGAQFELPLAYDKAADEQSWEELKSLLATAF